MEKREEVGGGGGGTSERLISVFGNVLAEVLVRTSVGTKP